MKSLGSYFGSKEDTFYGLSGIGDLSVTAFGKFSRNRAFGILIGKGYSVKDADKKINMQIEGISATHIVKEICTKHEINMPIVIEVYSILFDNKNPKIAINQLMDRKLKQEIIK